MIGIITYISCPSCGQTLVKSTLGVRSHLNMHVRKKEISIYQKSEMDRLIFPHGWARKGRNKP